MATRQRRTPQAAKLAILEAAERQLHDEGPEGVRIHRIAADLGITDAAVHYHFGTRKVLMSALLRRIGRRLVDDIAGTIESWAPDQVDVTALGTLFQRAYADERAAKLALWLRLAGWQPKGSGMSSRWSIGFIAPGQRRPERRAGPRRMSLTPSTQSPF